MCVCVCVRFIRTESPDKVTPVAPPPTLPKPAGKRCTEPQSLLICLITDLKLFTRHKTQVSFFFLWLF